MAPTSSRKRNISRKEAQLDQAEPHSATQTPTRKRRKVNGPQTLTRTSSQSQTEPQPKNTIQSKIKQEERQSSVDSAEPEDNLEASNHLVEEVIRRLTVSKEGAGVTEQYHNDRVQSSSQAYAKIAGRNWTFYVLDLKVMLGRPIDEDQTPIKDTPWKASPSISSRRQIKERVKIDIDLGTNKTISREHVKIEYNEDTGWMIEVIGRNGIILDDERVGRKQIRPLVSGNIISVLGTQMIFLLPNVKPVINEEMRRQLFKEADPEAEAEVEAGEEELSDSANRDAQSSAYAPRLSPPIQSQPKPNAPVHTPKRGKLSAQTRASLPTSFSTPRVSPSKAAANSIKGKGQRPQSATSSSYQNASSRSSAVTATIGEDFGLETPLSKKEASRTKSSPSYRGVLMDNYRVVNYALDSSREKKPPYSYAFLISQAIFSTEDVAMSLSKIYDFIMEHYAYYRFNSSGSGWQNSIRHNLSLNKSFQKIPRKTDEPGKGMKWTIPAEFREEFRKKLSKDRQERLRHTTSLGPDSPLSAATLVRNMMIQNEQQAGSGVDGGERHGSRSTSTVSQKGPRSTTPPAYNRKLEESFTPPNNPPIHEERGPPLFSIRATSAKAGQVTPHFSQTQSFPALSENNIRINTTAPSDGLRVSFQSPPTLNSSQYDLSGPSGNDLFTPLPRAKVPGINASTHKAPSYYVRELFSSPAPFWRFVDIGSTPAKLPDMSPSKPAGEDDEMSPFKDGDLDEDDDEDNGADNKARLGAHRSSPPIYMDTQANRDDDLEDDEGEEEDEGEYSKAGTGSPTRNVSRMTRMESPLKRESGSTLNAVKPSKPPGTSSLIYAHSRSQSNQQKQPPPHPPFGGVGSFPTPNINIHGEQKQLPPPIGGAGNSLTRSINTTSASAGTSAGQVSGANSNGQPMKTTPFARIGLDEDDDDDSAVDLTKGFEKIGNFHRGMATRG